jgi:hypothetical protein
MASLFLRNRHPQKVYFVTKSHTTEWEVGDRISSEELKEIIELKGRQFISLTTDMDSRFAKKERR